MKTKIVLTTCLLILSACFVNNIILANKTQNKDITILSTPRLNQLSNKLINEYKKTYPEQNIQGVDFEEINLSESLTNTMSLALVSQEDISSLIDQSLWKMLIGRDVIVPVINAGNPFLDTLEKQGITPTGLAEIIRMGKGTWGKLLGSGNDRQVNIYTMSDKSIRPALSAFLKINPSEFQVVEMNSLNDFKKVILNDPFSIGFCRIIDVLVSENQGIAENIRLLPIDKNENGRIDYHEKIYDNPENFMRGVWIGKYPKLLVQNIYLVAGNFPKNKEVSDFAGWILTEGQQFLEPESFSELVFNERQTNLENLNRKEIILEPEKSQYALQKVILFIFIFFIVIGLLIILTSHFRRQKIEIMPPGIPIQSNLINEDAISLPKGLYYDKTHTWVYMEQNGVIKLGIDDFLQHITGNYTRVIMKAPGEIVKKNEPILSLARHGKKISIYSPVSGTIKEINEELITEPSLINRSPYSEGWVYMLEPSNWLREIGFFKMSREYREWLKIEFSRLRAFLVETLNSKNFAESKIIYQEGGELINHILKDMEPDIWEDFQKNFIDTSKL